HSTLPFSIVFKYCPSAQATAEFGLLIGLQTAVPSEAILFMNCPVGHAASAGNRGTHCETISCVLVSLSTLLRTWPGGQVRTTRSWTHSLLASSHLAELPLQAA